MTTAKKATAVGTLVLAILDCEKKRGGFRKAQSIVGKKLLYQDDFKKWRIANTRFKTMTTAQINSLTKKLKES